jgi:hypothetical protein
LKIPPHRDIQTCKESFTEKNPVSRNQYQGSANPDTLFYSIRLLQIQGFLSAAGSIDTDGVITYSSPPAGDVLSISPSKRRTFNG